MKLSEILNGLDILSRNVSGDPEITSLCCDSRKVTEGSLFVAVRGYETDGHKYIPSALQKGARVILCEEAPAENCEYVAVSDSRKALALAACAFYGHPSRRMTMMGITGTNGKTTTTHLVKHILESAAGKKTGLIGTNGILFGKESLPSDRTTPESCELQQLLREMADAGCEACTMEVSSHSLELSRVAGITYDVAAFSNLTQDHLDFHKTMDNYAAAKAKLFSSCRHAVINRDDSYADVMLGSCKGDILTYGLSEGSGLRATDIVLKPSSSEFTVSYENESIPAVIHIPGGFSVYNALCAMGCCLKMGLTLRQCVDALATAEGVKGRMEPVPGTKDFTVLIDYSHTPDALEKAIETVKETSLGRTVVLFGCGGDRDRTKRPQMGAIATEKADYVYITSDNPRTEKPEDIIQDILEGVSKSGDNYCVVADRVKAITRAILEHRKGDTLILAGKGHETYQEVNKVKHHMDEREIAASALRLLEEREKA